MIKNIYVFVATCTHETPYVRDVQVYTCLPVCYSEHEALGLGLIEVQKNFPQHSIQKVTANKIEDSVFEMAGWKR